VPEKNGGSLLLMNNSLQVFLSVISIDFFILYEYNVIKSKWRKEDVT